MRFLTKSASSYRACFLLLRLSTETSGLLYLVHLHTLCEKPAGGSLHLRVQSQVNLSPPLGWQYRTGRFNGISRQTSPSKISGLNPCLQRISSGQRVTAVAGSSWENLRDGMPRHFGRTCQIAQVKCFALVLPEGTCIMVSEFRSHTYWPLDS